MYNLRKGFLFLCLYIFIISQYFLDMEYYITWYKIVTTSCYIVLRYVVSTALKCIEFNIKKCRAISIHKSAVRGGKLFIVLTDNNYVKNTVDTICFHEREREIRYFKNSKIRRFCFVHHFKNLIFEEFVT